MVATGCFSRPEKGWNPAAERYTSGGMADCAAIESGASFNDNPTKANKIINKKTDFIFIIFTSLVNWPGMSATVYLLIGISSGIAIFLISPARIEKSP